MSTGLCTVEGPWMTSTHQKTGIPSLQSVSPVQEHSTSGVRMCGWRDSVGLGSQHREGTVENLCLHSAHYILHLFPWLMLCILFLDRWGLHGTILTPESASRTWNLAMVRGNHGPLPYCPQIITMVFIITYQLYNHQEEFNFIFSILICS